MAKPKPQLPRENRNAIRRLERLRRRTESTHDVSAALAIEKEINRLRAVAPVEAETAAVGCPTCRLATEHLRPVLAALGFPAEQDLPELARLAAQKLRESLPT